MTKIWDALTGFLGWGWPLPEHKHCTD